MSCFTPHCDNFHQIRSRSTCLFLQRFISTRGAACSVASVCRYINCRYVCSTITVEALTQNLHFWSADTSSGIRASSYMVIFSPDSDSEIILKIG